MQFYKWLEHAVQDCILSVSYDALKYTLALQPKNLAHKSYLALLVFV